MTHLLKLPIYKFHFSGKFIKLLQLWKMNKEQLIKNLIERNAEGDALVKCIEKELPALHKAAENKQAQNHVAELMKKNEHLKSELEFWKARVIDLEAMNGIEQVVIPGYNNNSSSSIINSSFVKSENNPSPSAEKLSVEESNSAQKETLKQLKKESAKVEKKEKPAKSEKQPAPEENKEVNVSRLDMRVGRIISAKKHPDAESLYVEEIDLGEEKPRTVVSGLVKYVPLEEMQNRLVIVLCNLKPAKMRGITSEAMVMCASTPEKVEILCPPPDSTPGDRVICEEYPGEPDSILPPKKKIFEQVAPDLKTNNECVATFKDAPLKVAGKGLIKSITLKGVQIK